MKTYSHSRLEAFQNCPLMYKYENIDRIKSDRDGIEAFMGSRSHEALEKLYRDLKLSRLNSEEELAGYYNEVWDKNWHEKVFIVRKDYTAEDYRRTGEKAVRDYYRRYAPFDQGKTVWIEQNIRVKLDEAGEYVINGFVDRLVDLGNGAYEVHDYKTSNTLPSQEYLDRQRQLALYQLAVEDYFSDVGEVELVWHYLVFDKELRSTRTHEQLVKLRSEVMELIDEIEGTDEFQANECSLCAWCDYQDICPKHKHLFQVEELPVREFKADDGVRLADRYVLLKEQEKEAKAEAEALKLDIGEYCKQLDVDRLRGSNKILTVTIAEKSAFPKSDSKERPALEEAIREIGRWDEVAPPSLSLNKLEKAYRERSWPEEELSRLEPFVSLEESVTIRQRKAEEIGD